MRLLVTIVVLLCELWTVQIPFSSKNFVLHKGLCVKLRLVTCAFYIASTVLGVQNCVMKLWPYVISSIYMYKPIC